MPILSIDETANQQNTTNELATTDLTALPLVFRNVLIALEAPEPDTLGTVMGIAASGANSVGSTYVNFSASNIVDVGFLDKDGNTLNGDASGLKTTDGVGINLFTYSGNNNVVLGVRADNGNVAFAIYLETFNSTDVSTNTAAGLDPGAVKGRMWLVQYEPLSHLNADATPNDLVSMTDVMRIGANSVTSFDATDAPSGNVLFMMVGDGTPVAGESGFIVTGETPANQSTGVNISTGSTVNTSKGGGPITFGSDSQMLVPDKGLWFSFVKLSADSIPLTVPELSSGEAGLESNIKFDSYLPTFSTTFSVVQLQQGKAATLTVTAYNTTDHDPKATDPNLGGPTKFIDDILDVDPTELVNIFSVTITRTVKTGNSTVTTGPITFYEPGSGQTSGTLAGVTVTFGTNNVTIAGAVAVDAITYNTGTFTTPAAHNRVFIENTGGASGAAFDIGEFNIASGSQSSQAVDAIDFYDDVPSAAVVRTTDFVTLDETQGVRAGDANAATDDITGSNTDPFAGAYGTPIGALSAVDLVNTNHATGADSAGATSTMVLRIDNVSSGLSTVAGVAINLFMESDGTVTGRAGALSTSPVAFAIKIDNDGKVSVAQYLALLHSGITDPDDQLNLSGTLSAVGTIKDGDKDEATNSVAIGAAIRFDDDGPTATATQLDETVDEDGLTGGNAATAPGDVAGAVVTETGSIAGVFSFGRDGAGSYGLVNPASGTPSLSSGGVGLTYGVVSAAGVATLTASAGTNTVFTFELTEATGAYTFNLAKPLDHPTQNGETGDNSENDLDIDLSVFLRATDRDGDSVGAADDALVVTVNDDSPINFTPASLTLTNSGTASGSAALNSGGKVGADGFGSLVFVDNIPGDTNYLRMPSTDGTGALLLSGGENIVVSGFGTGTLTATTATTGLTVFTATLNTTTHQYTVDFDRAIDDGGGIDFLGAAPVRSGNPRYNIVANVDGTQLDLVFSGGTVADPDPMNDSVNVSTQGAGTNNQSMNIGDLLRIDFIEGAVLSGSPNGSSFAYAPVAGVASGLHDNVNGFSFLVTQNTSAGTTGTVFVRAIDADNDLNMVAGVDPGDTVDTVSRVLVNDMVVFGPGAVTTMPTIHGTQIGVYTHANGIVITGLNEGATGDGIGTDDPEVTVYTSSGFNRVEVANYAGQTIAGHTGPLGGTSFDIAPAGLDISVMGTAFEFDLAVQMTDFDGDSGAVALIGVDVNPVPI